MVNIYMANKDFITKQHISIKSKIDDVEQTIDDLSMKLKFFCSTRRSTETDLVYLINDLSLAGNPLKIKLRMHDAALKKNRGRTIITEELLSGKNDLCRDTYVCVDSDVSSRRFHEVKKPLGEPDYLISKDRMIFSKDVETILDYKDSDLRIYVDSQIEITPKDEEKQTLPDAFIEFQLSYTSKEEKQAAAKRLWFYVGKMDMTVGDIVKESYTDMIRKPNY